MFIKSLFGFGKLANFRDAVSGCGREQKGVLRPGSFLLRLCLLNIAMRICSSALMSSFRCSEMRRFGLGMGLGNDFGEWRCLDDLNTQFQHLQCKIWRASRNPARSFWPCISADYRTTRRFPDRCRVESVLRLIQMYRDRWEVIGMACSRCMTPHGTQENLPATVSLCLP